MKSIKEKAEEHLNSVYAGGYDDIFKELVKESYVSGANYVLVKICEIFDNNSSCEKVILEIGKLLCQLKK